MRGARPTGAERIFNCKTAPAVGTAIQPAVPPRATEAIR
jgi:hypothetical protein